MSALELRPYQHAAIEAAIASPWQRKLIVLSTGLGKTITGLGLAKKRGGRLLWLAHTEELVTQPMKAAQLVWPEVTHGIVKAERNEFMRHAVFASIQSAQQPRRLEQLVAQGFTQVVCDEAHHGLSPGYRVVFDALGCFREGGPDLLGLTATPERSDQGALDEVFQGIVYQVGITSAIEGGYLVPPTVVERPIRVDLDAVNVTRGDFGQKALDLALMEAGIVQEITGAYEEHCAGKRKTLIFVVSVAQAEQVAKALRERGHAAVAVSGETDREERRRILAKLASGEIGTVVNCMVLTEGFDCPSVDAVILARPTQSKPLMIQMVGRGLRLFPSKRDCLVIDMVGISKRHTLVQAAVLFGLKPPDVDEDKEPTGPKLDPLANPEEYWRERFRAQIEGVKGAPRSQLRWLAAGLGWALPAGPFGTVRLIPRDGEQWIVDVIGGSAPQVLSDQPVGMDTAQAIAEDFVRRVEAVRYASERASWREGAATAKQAAILRKLGVKSVEGMTSGTASDLITQRKSEPATQKQIALLRRSGVRGADNMTKREAMRAIAQLRRDGGW